MKITQRVIPEQFAAHMRAMKFKLHEIQQAMDKHAAAMYHLEIGAQAAKKHMSLTLELIREQMGLPEGRYTLSEDGLSIIGEEELKNGLGT